MTCRYGLTVIAEANGELNYNCKLPATRTVRCLDDRMPSSMAAIDLCETHYQEYLKLRFVQQKTEQLDKIQTIKMLDERIEATEEEKTTKGVY